MIKCTFASIIGKDFCLDSWLENIQKIAMPKEDMMLLWVVSQNMDYAYVCKRFDEVKKGFQESMIIRTPFRFYSHQSEATSPQGFLKKRWGVAFNMNLVNQYRKGDLFIVEDDIFPPSEAYQKLSTLARIQNAGAATGVARSFKALKSPHTYSAWIFIKKPIISRESIALIKEEISGFNFFDYQIVRMPDGEGVEDIHASGTVCTYIKKEALKDYIFVGESNLFTGQDVNLGWHITHELNLRYLADWSVKCEHWELDEQDNLVKK